MYMCTSVGLMYLWVVKHIWLTIHSLSVTPDGSLSTRLVPVSINLFSNLFPSSNPDGQSGPDPHPVFCLTSDDVTLE